MSCLWNPILPQARKSVRGAGLSGKSAELASWSLGWKNPQFSQEAAAGGGGVMPQKSSSTAEGAISGFRWDPLHRTERGILWESISRTVDWSSSCLLDEPVTPTKMGRGSSRCRKRGATSRGAGGQLLPPLPTSSVETALNPASEILGDAQLFNLLALRARPYTL